jgi:hypothetical protein
VEVTRLVAVTGADPYAQAAGFLLDNGLTGTELAALRTRLTT